MGQSKQPEQTAPDDDLAAYDAAPYNPRTITPEALASLQASERIFGDLSGLVVNKRTNNIVCGHQRRTAAKVLALDQLPITWIDETTCNLGPEARRFESAERFGYIILGSGQRFTVREVDWPETFEKAANVSANNPAIQGTFTAELVPLLDEIQVSLDEPTFEGLALDELALDFPAEPEEGQTDPDDVPEPQEDIVTKTGDLWLCGEHRVLCGDATKKEDVERLMDGGKAALVHADPPYGMGKESDGIANDNLYAEKLDAFQMAWWAAVRPHTADNGSAYIWGNAEDLWRLWYRGGLKDSERLTFRNEIIWDQVTGVSWGKDGMAGLRMYAPMGERCLFFMLGEQGFNNNADNYWEGWESIRAYLDAERKKCGWSIPDTKRIAGHSEKSGCHWFDKSQWSMPTEETYRAWQRAAREHDAFKREHDELKREHDAFKREHDELKREFYSTRAYFDNAHDNMTDVWEFQRVTGEERHGHATPKPVEMICRAIKSSTPEGAIVADPFLGSGTTMIAAEQLNRKCYGLEIAPQYVDVIIRRWQEFTGKEATLESSGKTFAETWADRSNAESESYGAIKTTEPNELRKGAVAQLGA